VARNAHQVLFAPDKEIVMKKIAVIIVAVAVTLALTSPEAFATLIYDNGAPNQVNGFEATRAIEADDFTLPAPALITDVRFWDLELSPGYNGSITWFIYDNNGNQPGNTLATGFTTLVTHTPTGTVVDVFTEFQNDFSIGAVPLLAGTTYWLGLHNGPLTHDTFDYFYWETTNDNGTLNSQRKEAPFATSSWTTNPPLLANDTELAFQLYGVAAVPEPATLFLLGSGLAGLAAWRRRQAA